ncbi:MAG: T9SS type A sorting domain-containing protein [Saprospiraceae bacterium]|nr:T9SS type A sorting domain-containing protein [Saprospiraceae bacterium]
MDYDGQYSYIDITSVRYNGYGITNIYPNPATSDVTITTSSTTSLQIMDVYGRLLKRQDISEGQNTLNVSALPR